MYKMISMFMFTMLFADFLQYIASIKEMPLCLVLIIKKNYRRNALRPLVIKSMSLIHSEECSMHLILYFEYAGKWEDRGMPATPILSLFISSLAMLLAICIFTGNCGRCCPLGPRRGAASALLLKSHWVSQRGVQADGVFSDCIVLNCSAPQH